LANCRCAPRNAAEAEGLADAGAHLAHAALRIFSEWGRQDCRREIPQGRGRADL